MIKKYLQHYLKGGMFKAIYNPIKQDVSKECLALRGREIICFQNMLITPISDNKDWMGQFRFNSSSIYGWFPEEDITIIEILEEYVDNPESLPVYMYRLYYNNQEQLEPNFGKGNWKAPMIVAREYTIESDEYVKQLSNPQASKIEKAVWNGEKLNKINWMQIL